MADHLKPTIATPYTTFVTEFHARIDDSVKMLDSQDVPSPVKPPVGSVRINRTIASFQRWSGTAWVTFGGYIPSGTIMLFQQSTAPIGWTKLTTHNNKALRVVSGIASSGGTSTFSSVFTTKSVTGSISGTTGTTTATGSLNNVTAGGTVVGHVLTIAEIPSHTHSIANGLKAGGSEPYNGGNGGDFNMNSSVNTGSSGSGAAHAHGFSGTPHSHSFTGNAHSHAFSGALSGSSLDMNLQYVDVILAKKD